MTKLWTPKSAKKSRVKLRRKAAAKQAQIRRREKDYEEFVMLVNHDDLYRKYDSGYFMHATKRYWPEMPLYWPSSKNPITVIRSRVALKCFLISGHLRTRSTPILRWFQHVLFERNLLRLIFNDFLHANYSFEE